MFLYQTYSKSIKKSETVQGGDGKGELVGGTSTPPALFVQN